jgi:hypothetical protein
MTGEQIERLIDGIGVVIVDAIDKAGDRSDVCEALQAIDESIARAGDGIADAIKQAGAQVERLTKAIDDHRSSNAAGLALIAERCDTRALLREIEVAISCGCTDVALALDAGRKARAIKTGGDAPSPRRAVKARQAHATRHYR